MLVSARPSLPDGRPLGVALAAALVLLAVRPLAAQLDPWADPARVLVIYNTSWPDGDLDGAPDSTEVAQYYALRRGVPAGNLLGLPLTPTSEAYGAGQWPLFLAELRDPIAAALAAHGETSIDTLLFCYGVPYQVDVPGQGPRSIDDALAVLNALGTAAAPIFKATQYTNPLKETSPHIGTDIGHFDHALHQFLGTTMYLWARLDGLTVEHSKALVDRALYGQAHISPAPGAYGGFGYVDTRFGQYTDAFLLTEYPVGYLEYADGDVSMAYGKFFVEQSGFPLRWEPWETEIGEPGAVFSDLVSAELADDALFYGGWYNYGKYQHAWEWKAGSFACDLNSNSAQGIRSAGTASFLCQAFQENLTAGAGVIAEPYLNGHNRPDIFLAYILDGFSWAEASAISDPGVKWMSLHLGDPLYRIDPEAATLDTSAPAPIAWLGADHASLELVLPAVPGDAPGGEEVFRVSAVASGSFPVGGGGGPPVSQPDDRRRQLVAVPGAAGPGLTWVSAAVVDPAGNAGATPLQHFVGPPIAPSSAVVAADDADVSRAEPLVLRYSFGAAGGLLTHVTGFAMTVSLPNKGLVDFPVSSILLPLAGNYLLTHSLDQVNFAIAFPPGAWPDGPATFKVSLTANGQTSTSSVDVTVGG